jgi:hypothetical protein
LLLANTMAKSSCCFWICSTNSVLMLKFTLPLPTVRSWWSQWKSYDKEVMITEGRIMHVAVDGPWAVVSSDSKVIIHVTVDGPWAGWSYDSFTIIHVTVDGPWAGVRAQGARLYHTSYCWRSLNRCEFGTVVLYCMCVYFGVFWSLSCICSMVLCSQFCLSHSLEITVTSMEKMLNLFCLFIIGRIKTHQISGNYCDFNEKMRTLFCIFFN